MKLRWVQLATFLLGMALLAGCAHRGELSGSYEASPLAPQQADAFAFVIADGLRAAHPPASVSLALEVSGPLGERLEARLRQLGYSINPSAPRLTYRLEPWDHGAVWLAAAMPALGWRMDGVYSLNTAGEWALRGPLAIRDDRKGKVLAAVAAPQAPVSADACGTVSIEPGSLRENIARELLECGYQLGEWRLGSDGYIDDWVISETYELTVANGVRGLLQALADQYGLGSELRPVAQRVDFMYQREGRR